MSSKSTAVGRPAAQSKAFKTTLGNKDVVGMFNDTLNPSNDATKLPIVYKKYEDLRALSSRFLKALSFIRDMPAVAATFPGPCRFLADYITALTRQSHEIFIAPDISTHLITSTAMDVAMDAAGSTDFSKVPPDIATLYVKTYNEAKKCNLINIMIVVCRNLSAQKGSLIDVNNLQDQFLKGAGTIFSPFPSLPQLNIKQVYTTIGEMDRKMMLTILSRFYTITHEVHEIVTSPDADMSELVHVVLSSIDDVKKQIPRCDQAFAKIAESVEMLKGNFKSYYSDYVSSGNSSIILENFVLDVSKSSKSSPAVTAQFRRIITHYRKLSSSNNDPKLRALFGQAEANFREAEDIKGEPDGQDADIVSDIPAEGSVTPTETKTTTATGEASGAAAGAAGASAAKNRRKKAKARTKAREKAVAIASGTGSLNLSDVCDALLYGAETEAERFVDDAGMLQGDESPGLADELDLNEALKDRVAQDFFGIFRPEVDQDTEVIIEEVANESDAIVERPLPDAAVSQPSAVSGSGTDIPALASRIVTAVTDAVDAADESDIMLVVHVD